MAKPKPKSEAHRMAVDRDPNHCFVIFSSTYWTASNVSIGLQSLQRQVALLAGDKTVKRMEFLPAERKLVIDFE